MLIFKHLLGKSAGKVIVLDVLVNEVKCIVEEELLPTENGTVRERDWFTTDLSGKGLPRQDAAMPWITLGRLNLQFQRKGKVEMPKYFVNFQISSRHYQQVSKLLGDLRRPILWGESHAPLANEYFEVSMGSLENRNLIAMGSLSQLVINLSTETSNKGFGQGSFVIQDRRLSSPFLSEIAQTNLEAG
jgi:hypothetical protein